MKKTTFLLAFCLWANFGFTQQISTDHKITFRLKITELENPGSVSIIGPVRPWINFNAATKTVMTIDSNGFYSAILNIPDSLLYKKLKYTFRNDKNKTDIRREILKKIRQKF